MGIVGLGKVGRITLMHALHNSKGIPIHWVSDSEVILSKRSEPFTPREISTIVNVKARGRSLSSCRKRIPNALVAEFQSPRQESRILNSIMTRKSEWIVIDTASLTAADDYEIIKALMGSAGLCSASKTPWAEYRFCSDLYREAERRETFLGLNCTTGVWVDQMESIPLIMNQFTKGRVTITKRDNTSLNMFLAKVGAQTPPGRALREIEEAGHMEPGAKGLSAEVHDQVLKARIATNICGILRGTEPNFADETSSGYDRPQSMSPDDIASWHIEGMKNNAFRALITEIVLERNRNELLTCTVSFGQLPEKSPLARHFPGKNAIFVESTNASDRFDEKKRLQPIHGFFHSGYGGAELTAANLIWEAKRISRLRRFKGKTPFTPLPILFEKAMGKKSAVNLWERIAGCLGWNDSAKPRIQHYNQSQ
jgi:hypothetical protein